MRLIEYLKLPDIGSDSIYSFKTAHLREDISNAFKDKEDDIKYLNLNHFELLIGYNRITIVILYRNKIEIIFDCEDINQDESYLVLKYGKIILKELS